MDDSSKHAIDDHGPVPDTELINQIAAGDSDALRQLFDRYFKLVFAIGLRICRQQADAQAVTTTVFWEIWKDPNRFHPSRGSFRTYLALLARSRARDLARGVSTRRNRQERAAQDLEVLSANRSDPLDPAVLAETEELKSSVRGILDSLPHEVRTVLIMSFYEGLTHDEIAEALDVPLGTVKSRIRRGLQRLGEKMRSGSNTMGT